MDNETVASVQSDAVEDFAGTVLSEFRRRADAEFFEDNPARAAIVLARVSDEERRKMFAV